MISEFILAEITLRGRYSIYDTVTLAFRNRSANCPAEFDHYAAVIESISGLGVEGEEYYPRASRGVITLDNSRESLAFQKRISDLTHRLIFNNAEISIYTAERPIGSDCIDATKTLLWKGRVVGTSASNNNESKGQKFSINVEHNFEEHLISKAITENEFPNASSEAIGQTPAVVIGQNVEVKPYLTDLIAGAGNVFGFFSYATNLKKPLAGSGRQFVNAGVGQILVADPNRENDDEKIYRSVYINTGGVSFRQGLTATGGNINNFEYIHAFPIPYTPNVTNKYVVYGIELPKLTGTGVGGAEGELIVRIHAQRKNRNRPKAPDKYLAEAVFDKETFATYWKNGYTPAGALGGGGVMAIFNRPVPLCDPNYNYWISFTGTNETVAASRTTMPLYSYESDTPSAMRRFSTPETTTNASQKGWIRRSQNTARFYLHCVGFQDDAAATFREPDVNGLNFSELKAFVYCDNVGLESLTTDIIKSLDMVLVMNGLTDTASGEISGTANLGLNFPHFVVNMMLHQYSAGVGWMPTAGQLNSRFSSTWNQFIGLGETYYRKLDGSKTGRVTNWDIIREACRNGYSKLSYDSTEATNQYSLLAVGHSRSSVATLTDNDCTIQRVFSGDLKSVVNKIDLKYYKKLSQDRFFGDVKVEFPASFFNSNMQASVKGGKQLEGNAPYSKLLSMAYNDGGTGQGLSALSFLHYGERVLQNPAYDLIQSDAAANSVAKLLLSLHDHPPEYVEILAPHRQFKALKQYHVIEIISTAIPNEAGTNPHYTPDYNYYDWIGSPVVRARSVLGEIISINNVKNGDEPMQILILARLLVQWNDPLYNYTN